MISSKLLFISYPFLVGLLLVGGEQPNARVESANSAGRTLEEETRASVVRNYLQAWQGLDRALSENRPDALDECFVGVAKEKLADTIRLQKNLGIQVFYREQTHDLEIVFYSPDGLSIQLVDKVGYRLEVLDRGRVVGSQPVQSRYVAVMTPTEARWKVRILQAEPR